MHRIAFVFLVACGADPGPAPTTPVVVDQCTRACNRQASCLPAGYADRDPTGCLKNCRANLVTRDGDAYAKSYADCLENLSCDDIEKSMTMDMGPVGFCYSKAINPSRQ
jgi:hypothetical protein